MHSGLFVFLHNHLGEPTVFLYSKKHNVSTVGLHKAILHVYVLHNKFAIISYGEVDLTPHTLTWQCLMKRAATMKLRTSDPSIMELQNWRSHTLSRLHT